MLSVIHVDAVCVISPHLDDAVFSCGDLLAACADAPNRSTVLTVLAGLPPPSISLTWYDERCGFETSDEAVRTRWTEDDNALAALNTVSVRMAEQDSQYAPLPEPEALALRLRDCLAAIQDSVDTVVVPMGLFHCDHECVADACLALMKSKTGAVRWVAYEDVLYRRRHGVLQQRLVALFQNGVTATPITLLGPAQTIDSPPHAEAKRRAVQCYQTQLRELSMSAGGDETSPERYWLLSLT